MTTITIRTNEDIKKKLQAKAKNLGLSLNQLINLIFRHILNSNKLEISINDDNIEYDETIQWNQEIEKSYNQALQELQNGEVFTMKDLKKLLKKKGNMK